LKPVNDGLKEIAMILDIEAELTTYVARHSFATTLKRQSVDIAKISQSLGHAEVLTTKAYLKQFEDGEMDELDALL
jgi:integrase/recombinase XerD